MILKHMPIARVTNTRAGKDGVITPKTSKGIYTRLTDCQAHPSTSRERLIHTTYYVRLYVPSKTSSWPAECRLQAIKNIIKLVKGHHCSLFIHLYHSYYADCVVFVTPNLLKTHANIWFSISPRLQSPELCSMYVCMYTVKNVV